ncbi:MAG: hypothetical protein R3C45_11585 [Phycisphaerales bacterium]
MRTPIMHIAKWSAVVALCLQLAVTARAEDRPAPHAGQRIANAYGFAHWDEVVEIRYTFNVKTPERETARHWTWRPKDDTVTLEVEGEPTITYKRGELDENTSDEVMTADKRFINDSYWFLFPYQLVWSNPTITDRGESPLPIGEGTGRKLTVQYPAEGGYTPGDAYDIYLGGDALITHWVFRKGGGDKGNPMTWENTIDLGPIKVCTDHYNTDKSFRLFFTSIRLTTADGKTFDAD